MLQDDSPMPFGKYKGDKMINVPASYLLWLYNENKCNKNVRDYIEDNLDVLKMEVKK
uniref:Putative quorum-sensing-regulated virulence factor n=1 Tax=viral metagenome TaxID=1070528 RepID=A0A6M3LLS0_9ZZZZ